MIRLVDVVNRWAVGLILLILLGVVVIIGLMWLQYRVAVSEESDRKIIQETTVVDYSELSKDDINKRSKVLFGKNATEIQLGDVDKKSQNKNNSETTSHEAARMLAAVGETDKSLKMFKNSIESSKTVDQDVYRNFRDELDKAGRHTEATALIKTQIKAMKSERPYDEIAIYRLESLLESRGELYK